jgi:hypothetical protein
MSSRRVVGLVLVIVGLVALAMGGVFWTDRDTVLDAGPIEVTTAEREGFALPPLVGGIVLVSGLALLVVPSRRKA